jgi:putative endonuclease
MEREYYVYILSNNSQVLYIGVTNDLERRLYEHVAHPAPGSFVARYNLDGLVYYESYPTAPDAIYREKQLKGWRRDRKKELIHEMNPVWRNLLDDLRYGMMDIPEKAGGTDPSTSSG